MKKSITVDEAIDYLNNLLQTDEKAIKLLCLDRVECNNELAEHSRCFVELKNNKNSVGLLGVINGMFASDKDSCGQIALETLEVDDEEVAIRFIKIQREN